MALDYGDVHYPRLGDNMAEDFEENKKDDEEELEKDGSEVIEEIADEIGDKVEDLVEEVLGGGGGPEDVESEKSEDDEGEDDIEKDDDEDEEDLDKCKKSDDEDEEEVEKEDEDDEDLEKSEDEDDEDVEKEDDDDEDPDVEKSWTVPLFKSGDEQVVYGVVSEPNSIDLQGDILTESEIRKAAHAFMMKSQRIGHEHNGPANAEIIESYIAPTNFECGGQVVKKGSWVMAVKIHDPSLWGAVKKGEINGFSIAGSGVRTPMTS